MKYMNDYISMVELLIDLKVTCIFHLSHICEFIGYTNKILNKFISKRGIIHVTPNTKNINLTTRLAYNHPLALITHGIAPNFFFVWNKIFDPCYHHPLPYFVEINNIMKSF